MSLPARRIPESVAALDVELVAATLVRCNASVRNAARELGVPSADLRKMLLLDDRFTDAMLEAAEQRLDDAESNLDEALHCDDPRRRDTASMFFLRNTNRAARRGYAVNGAAASLEIKSTEPQHITFHWGSPDAEREVETFERDGKTFEVPRYGNGRQGDDAIEGALAEPAAMIGHTPVMSEPPTEDARRIKTNMMREEPVEPHMPRVMSCPEDQLIDRHAAPAEPPLPEWPGPYPPPPLVAHLYRPWVPPDPVEANRRRLEQLRRWSSRGAA